MEIKSRLNKFFKKGITLSMATAMALTLISNKNTSFASTSYENNTTKIIMEELTSSKHDPSIYVGISLKNITPEEIKNKILPYLYKDVSEIIYSRSNSERAYHTLDEAITDIKELQKRYAKDGGYNWVPTINAILKLTINNDGKLLILLTDVYDLEGNELLRRKVTNPETTTKSTDINVVIEYNNQSKLYSKIMNLLRKNNRSDIAFVGFANMNLGAFKSLVVRITNHNGKTFISDEGKFPKDYENTEKELWIAFENALAKATKEEITQNLRESPVEIEWENSNLTPEQIKQIENTVKDKPKIHKILITERKGHSVDIYEISIFDKENKKIATLILPLVENTDKRIALVHITKRLVELKL